MRREWHRAGNELRGMLIVPRLTAVRSIAGNAVNRLARLGRARGVVTRLAHLLSPRVQAGRLRAASARTRALRPHACPRRSRAAPTERRWQLSRALRRASACTRRRFARTCSSYITRVDVIPGIVLGQAPPCARVRATADCCGAGEPELPRPPSRGRSQRQRSSDSAAGSSSRATDAFAHVRDARSDLALRPRIRAARRATARGDDRPCVTAQVG